MFQSAERMTLGHGDVLKYPNAAQRDKTEIGTSFRRGDSVIDRHRLFVGCSVEC
jgi:hypothetical protein